MPSLIARPVSDRGEWDRFLSGRAEANFLQSWQWGDFNEALGKRVHRIGLFEDGAPVGLMLAVVEDAPDIRCLAVWGGPILDWGNAAHVRSFITEARRLAKAEKCAFLRVRPQLEADEGAQRLFSTNKFVRAPRNLHAEWTSIVDLTLPDERLLANMSQSTRAKVRKARSAGVTVTATNDPAAVARYCAIQRGTCDRKGFEPYADDYYEKQFQIFAATGSALLFSAERAGEVLAQAIIVFHGKEAVYHYGASTDAGRKFPGAHLLHWEVMQEAKRRGMTRYNFWGIAPIGDEQHRYACISQFKRGFGGADFEYLYARHLVLDYPRYAHNLLVGKMRKHLTRGAAGLAAASFDRKALASAVGALLRPQRTAAMHAAA